MFKTTTTRRQDMGASHLPISLLTATVLLTIVALMSLSWNTYHSYRVTKSAVTQNFKVANLCGRIIHLDEVLTMAVHMATVTGEPRWEQRYRGFKPRMADAIQDLKTVAGSGTIRVWVALAEADNCQLQDMHSHALKLVEYRNLKEAQTVISSQTYSEHKMALVQGMTSLADLLSDSANATLAIERKRFLGYATFAAIVGVGLLLVWFGSIRSVRRHILQRDKAEKAHQKTLDELERRVQERTAELKKMNQSLEHEIDERRKAEEKLRHDAHHDILTGLPNRALLLDRIEYCIERSKRDQDYQFAVIFLDVDEFKVINDSLGHEAGDVLLVELAQRVMKSVRSVDTAARPFRDTMARLGGDEFVVLLDGIKQENDATVVAQRIHESMSQPFELAGHELVITTSIGIANNLIEYDHPNELLRDADTALYQAKERGKDRQEVFDQGMRDQAIARLEIETDLRKAIEQGQLSLNYQPIISLITGRIESFEALLRWHHPKKGMIPPDTFIPIAEQTRLIVSIGQWVIREACHQAQAWHNMFPDRLLSIAVNLSSKQFSRNDLVQQIDRILAETGLDPHFLKFEITESVVMGNAKENTEVLSQLRDRELDLSMDDFGTGYSSLSYIHNLPIASIKLDRSFVRNMTANGEHAATIRAVVTLAHNRGMKVIAEGVETVQQLAQLQALKCDFGQGYFFSKPVTAECAEGLIVAGGHWRMSA